MMTRFTKNTILATLSALLTAYFSGCGNDKSASPPATPATIEYEVTVISAGIGAYGDGDYAPGKRVIIWAGTTPAGQEFKNWTTTSRDVILSDEHNATTTFIMPANAVTVTAVFEPIGGTGGGGDSTITSGGDGDSTITGDGDEDTSTTTQYYAVTVSGNGTEMTGDGRYAVGDTVTVTAGTPPAGYMFKNWTTTSNSVTFADANRAATTFVMPANSVTVTANFEAASTTNPTYKVTVSGAKGATGSGTYTPGMIVNITAGTDTTGQRFLNWTTMSDGVTFVNANSSVTSFNMPANNVTVTANFDNAATYAVTVSGGTGATGGGRYVSGKVVNITAGTVPTGQRFKNWTTSSSGVTFANANSSSTTFTMPGNAVTVTANFESIYTVTVSGGTGATGGGTYAVGATVNINAGTAPTGQRFKNWTTSSNGVSFGNANSASTSFPMPSNAVTVTAVFETLYTVTVSGGTGATGGGSYAAGATVSISAGTAPDGQVFKNWTTSSSGVTFGNANNASTTFTMPGNAVTVTANFISGFTDARDGKFYRTVTIGGKKWMAENLNYLIDDGSMCYNYSTENCNIYGRLYNWEAALNACPPGWRLASRNDWTDLTDIAGGSTKLKAKSGWSGGGNGTDDFGFSALPGGYHTDIGDIFEGAGDYGYWWTNSRPSGTPGMGYAYSKSMHHNDGIVMDDTNNKLSGYSVRCVQD